MNGMDEVRMKGKVKLFKGERRKERESAKQNEIIIWH